MLEKKLSKNESFNNRSLSTFFATNRNSSNGNSTSNVTRVAVSNRLKFLLFMALTKISDSASISFVKDNAHYVLSGALNSESSALRKIGEGFLQNVNNTLKQGYCGVVNASNLLPVETTDLWQNDMCYNEFTFSRDALTLGDKPFEDCAIGILNSRATSFERFSACHIDLGLVFLIVLLVCIGCITILLLSVAAIAATHRLGNYLSAARRNYQTIPDGRSKIEAPELVTEHNLKLEKLKLINDDEEGYELPDSKRYTSK